MLFTLCVKMCDGIADAPVFRPTPEQFKDPLAYIASIRAEAQAFGIAKIVPPADWRPPFVHDPARLKFLTKKQQLGVLEGGSRLARCFDRALRLFLFQTGTPLPAAPAGEHVLLPCAHARSNAPFGA
jgi:[histone H3]-trimethyl-L-lysine4 demethylase